MDEAAALTHHPPPLNMVPSPLGLQALYNACRKIYPDQPNPLQVTALLKYWLNGPDPLDYISMYLNPGSAKDDIPPHWHYVSFGLSDLHGDGRVHEPTGPEGASGFGFELTFRLKKEDSDTSAPTWPATLMQSLAKYVFQSANILCATDHVSWHCALDNSESRIQHMLMAADPQLERIRTPFGIIDFVQIVGICTEELKAAQQWNGAGILNILKRSPVTGGPWHITDMKRGQSIFELNPCAQEEVARGFELIGSTLSGVSGRCAWSEDDLYGGQDGKQLCASNQFFGIPPESPEMLHTRKLDGVHLLFNLEAGSLLPLAIKGRIKHGRHFTFKSMIGEVAITLVASSVTGTLVCQDSPYVSKGPWLQVLIPDNLAQEMAATLEPLTTPEALSLPKTFTWFDQKLSITISSDKA